MKPSGNQIKPKPNTIAAAPATCNAVAMSSLKIQIRLVSRLLLLFYLITLCQLL
jgi:hypothetical protein